MTQTGYWTSLKHNGVAFPDPYNPIGFEISVKGIKTKLPALAEEMVYAWAKKKDTPYVQDTTFQANFIKCLNPNLPPELQNLNPNIIDFDLSEPSRIVDEEKRRKELISKEEKKKIASERKTRREQLKQQYGYAELDCQRVEVANWMVEPPGLFMGRGNHPLRGIWKPRIYHKDVVLNLSKDAPVPTEDWAMIVHDQKCMWIASWVDKISGKNKYVWLADTASVRQKRDQMKYDKAAKLEVRIESVRGKFMRMLSSKKLIERKIATVCYLIDSLAMRVGDEKDEDEADTVGATTLRVEHIKIDGNKIFFDFLGKDSVRWQKTIEANQAVISNFLEFTRNKAAGNLIFDEVTSSMVNRALAKMMPGLSAKVFRTYIATNIVRDYLKSEEYKSVPADDFSKLYRAKMANLEAAIRCNHKRTPPKNWEKGLKKKEDRLQNLMSTNPKTEKARNRLEKTINKVDLQIRLAKATRDYNLNTSLKNYIDPRIYIKWAKQEEFNWAQLYTKALQRRFAWAGSTSQSS